MNYKEGDITKTGWEVISVTMLPIYTMRKRITVNDEVPESNKEYVGKQGWYYVSNGFKWVELDDHPNKRLQFRDVELDY